MAEYRAWLCIGRKWLPWLVGAVGSVAFIGPAFGEGALFNLDLVVTSKMPVPQGIWGLGPLPPRDIPYWLPVALASHAIGARAGALFFAAALTVAFAGAYRLAADSPVIARLGAGALYAFSPFTLTRVAVGHTGIVVATAALPWALPALLAPARRPARTFLSCLLLACTGVAGAILTGPPLIVGLIADRRRGLARPVALAVIAQLPWLIPALVVSSNGFQYADSRLFAADARDPLGVLRLVAGHGFWRTASQVGGSRGLGVPLIGAAIFGLALVGARHLRSLPAGRAAVAAGVGLALAWASALPELGSVYAKFSQTPVGLLLREGQRIMPVFLVWLAPAAALGATRLARAETSRSALLIVTLPLIAGSALAAPGAWGVHGALRPVRIPTDWASARSDIRAQPGTALALPFHEYVALGVARGRIVLNPLPIYLAGDVIASSDPELGAAHHEAVDPRESPVQSVLMKAAAGQPVANDLAALGVRWVVVTHDVDWRSYSALRTDPGLQWTVRGPHLDAYRVLPWKGPIVTDSGAELHRQALVTPFGWVPNSGAAVWARAGGPGWLRGMRHVHTTEAGLLGLPAGAGPLWYWPAILVLFADAFTLIVLFMTVSGVIANEKKPSHSCHVSLS